MISMGHIAARKSGTVDKIFTKISMHTYSADAKWHFDSQTRRIIIIFFIGRSDSTFLLIGESIWNTFFQTKLLWLLQRDAFGLRCLENRFHFVCLPNIIGIVTLQVDSHVYWLDTRIDRYTDRYTAWRHINFTEPILWLVKESNE